MKIHLTEFPYGSHFNEEIKLFFKVSIINPIEMCIFNLLRMSQIHYIKK